MNEMKPLVSVIIPTYNRASDLKRALGSLLSQTYTHWEALVVDNYSEDNTDQVIDDFNEKRIKLYKIHNKGIIAASRNLGIKHASGEYLAFLDSDDWWCEQKLEQSVACMNEGMDLVYHDLFLVFSNEQKRFWRKGYARSVKPPVFDNLIQHGNPMSNSSVVVRRALVEKVGGLLEDPETLAMEDFDCWLKISRLTDKFARLSNPLGYYWVGGGNVSNPKRDLLVLQAFEKRYLHYTTYQTPWWVNYTRGRASYLLEDYAIAKRALKQVSFRAAPTMVVLKSLWMRLNMALFV